MDYTGVRPSIAVIDDDPESLSALGELLALTLPEAEIRTQSDPEEALRELRIHPADLVIADYRMHPMDGLDFLRRVHEAAPRTKRILASAYPGDIPAHLGLDLVLVKPLATAPFIDRVRDLLHLRQQRT